MAPRNFKTLSPSIIDIGDIADVFDRDERVLFAYVYGSFCDSESPNDLDIAVYSVDGCDGFALSADLKIGLSQGTGLPPDIFDIRILNRLTENGDLFALLYLKNVFEAGRLILDKDFLKRSAFIEKYSMKYRECEGLFGEVLL